MIRIERSLPLLLVLVLALCCGTGCTAANYSMRSERSPGTGQASSQPLAMQNAPALSQTTSVKADTTAAKTQAEDRGINRTAVVLVCLAAVALLMVLAAR